MLNPGTGNLLLVDNVHQFDSICSFHIHNGPFQGVFQALVQLEQNGERLSYSPQINLFLAKKQIAGSPGNTSPPSAEDQQLYKRMMSTLPFHNTKTLDTAYLVNCIWVLRYVKDDSCGPSLNCPLGLQEVERERWRERQKENQLQPRLPSQPVNSSSRRRKKSPPKKGSSLHWPQEVSHELDKPSLDAPKRFGQIISSGRNCPSNPMSSDTKATKAAALQRKTQPSAVLHEVFPFLSGLLCSFDHTNCAQQPHPCPPPPERAQ